MSSSEENFEELLESSFANPVDSFEPGDSIETTIISIGGDTIFLHLSGKSEGVLNAEELKDKDGNLTVSEGDTIKVYFLSSQGGEMRFTTRISGDKAGAALLENAFKNAIPVEGVVDKEIKGGFQIKIGDSRAFCPFSQMGLRRVENPSDFVGKHLTFKITEFKENGRNILVSNRIILKEEHDKEVEALKDSLKLNTTITGTIKEIRDFGAFVDLGAVQALLPISEISRTRVNSVKDVLSVGQEIEAKIIKLDWQNEKISLSMKALQADPWDEAAIKYKSGTKHKGKIVRITDFGAFISLEPGLDGLLHVSDMKSENRNSRPQDLVKVGQSLNVLINSVDTERKRISLKQVSTDEEEQTFQKYMDSDDDSDGETYNPFADLLKK